MSETIRVLEREGANGGDGEPAGDPIFGQNIELIRGVKIRLEIVVGECEMSVGELFDLADGSVVKLDREVSAPVDILLGGKRVGRGTLVAVDESFGVRVTEIER